MDPNLQPLHDQFSAQVSAAQTNLAFVDAASATLIQAQADRDAALKARDDAQNANSQLLTEVSQLTADKANLQAQLNALNAVKVFDGLELISATVAGGSVANSAGNTGVAADAQGAPTDKNAFRQIVPAGQYQDKYWYWQLGADSTKTKYTYEIRLMLPTASDCNASQALELDIEHRVSHQCFNTGLQFDFAGSKTVRIWNRSTTPVHGWISTALPCPRWTPGQWHSVKLETHRDAANVYYDAVTIDGVRTSLAASFPLIPLSESDCLNCAVQLDGNSLGTAYLAYIDAVRFTAA